MAVKRSHKQNKTTLRASKLSNKAMQYHQIGKIGEAIPIYKDALKIFGHDINTLNNLGIAYFQIGNFDQAKRTFRRALNIAPKNAKIHYDLANVLLKEGRLTDAIEHYQAAISMAPNFVAALGNCGLAYKHIGKPEQAITCFERSLTLQPDDALVLNNLGTIFGTLGRFDDAIQCFRKALRNNATIAQIHFNLGKYLIIKGMANDAIQHYQNAIQLDANELAYWQSFADHIGMVEGHIIDGSFESLLIQCFNRSGINKNNLAKPAAHIILQQPMMAQLHHAIAAQVTDDVQEPAQKKQIVNALSHPLLIGLLENIVNTSVELELLLTAVRKTLLSMVVNGLFEKDTDDALVFICALANQCFFNEYVFFETPEERMQVELLKQKVQADMQDAHVNPLYFAMLGAYRPLRQLINPSDIDMQNQRAPFALLLERHIQGPFVELEISHTLPSISQIIQTTSQQVRAQYEKNPYPRWIDVSYHKRDILDSKLRGLFPFLANEAGINANSPDILIAGCGTGKHAIEVAMSVYGATITAIDLSVSSLSYAVRKALELDIANIKFFHGDILELGGMEKKFDVIESVGVLHHMLDPMAGFRALVSLLKPGGYMKIGLYSSIARKYIADARGAIASQLSDITDDEIREFRNNILRSPETDPRKGFFSNYRDFFGMSECRDLVFHVQEHCFTLPQLKTILDQLELSFLGFELHNRSILNTYQNLFPTNPKRNSLENWHAYELKYPNTFAGMYQFWVKK